MGKLWTFGDSYTFGHGCRMINDLNEKSNYKIMYKDYIDPNKPIWSEYVSEKLDLELLNYGINGATNDHILDNVLNQFTNFKKDDVIIIQSSTRARYDFPFFKSKKLMGGWLEEKRDNIYDPNNKSPYFFITVFSKNILNEYEEGGETTLLYSNSQYNTDNLKLSKQKYNLLRDFFGEFLYTKKYYEREIWRFIQMNNILTSLGLNVYLLHEDYWPEVYDKPKNLITKSDEGLRKELISSKSTILHETNGLIEDYHPGYSGHLEIAETILKNIL